MTIVRFVGALLLTLGLLGAAKLGLNCRLYNHTGLPIDFVRTLQHPKDGATPSVAWLPDGGSVLLPGWIWAHYEAQTATLSWRYVDVPEPPPEFDTFVGFLFWRQREFHAQIEPNGCIFVITPEAQPPVAQLPAQPEHFPICPK